MCIGTLLRYCIAKSIFQRTSNDTAKYFFLCYKECIAGDQHRLMLSTLLPNNAPFNAVTKRSLLPRGSSLDDAASKFLDSNKGRKRQSCDDTTQNLGSFILKLLQVFSFYSYLICSRRRPIDSNDPIYMNLHNV